MRLLQAIKIGWRYLRMTPGPVKPSIIGGLPTSTGWVTYELGYNVTYLNPQYFGDPIEWELGEDNDRQYIVYTGMYF
jgi:hypothetical protein